MATKHKFKVKMQKIGAWTVVFLPIDVKKVFGKTGAVRIKGTIDGFPFSDCSLMPVKAGGRCLAIKREIRKSIRKEAEESIEIILEQDFSELVIPEELIEAFEASPEAKKLFEAIAPSYKRNYAYYIDQSKKKETREKRAVDCVLRLEKEFFEKGLPKRKSPQITQISTDKNK
jgi:hypothetical protein